MLPDTNIELTPEQLDQMDQMVKLIPKVKEQIRRAKLAGINLTELDAQLAQTEKDLAALQRVYGRKTANSVRSNQ